jgi:hypothetical protein
MLLSTILTPHIFLTSSEWSLLISSLPQEIQLTNPLFKTHITIPCHLGNPLHMCKKMFCSTVLQLPVGYSKSAIEKFAHISC